MRAKNKRVRLLIAGALTIGALAGAAPASAGCVRGHVWYRVPSNGDTQYVGDMGPDYCFVNIPGWTESQAPTNYSVNAGGEAAVGFKLALAKP
jgi:hypothetical protein